MLGLIRAHEGGHDDVTLYTRLIRDELARTNGRPTFDWREHYDTGRVKRGQPGPEGSLFALADVYQKLGEREQRASALEATPTRITHRTDPPPISRAGI